MNRTAILLLVCLSMSPSLRAAGPETKALVEADWARQEKVARGLKIDDPAAVTGVIKRGKLMVADMKELGVNTDEAQKAIQDVEKKLVLLSAKRLKDRTPYKDLYLQLRRALRKLAFSNPKIDFDEIVFVKRHWPRHNHQCSHRVGEAQIPGANLCVLKGLSPDGEIREILDEKYAKGGIGRFDLSCDAQAIVFPYAAPRPTPTRYGYGRPGVRGGACTMYDVYRVDINGSGLQQLTNDPDAEDTEPIFLPDGRIAFMTSRDDRFVQCGDWAIACGMYSMNADGTDLRRVTEPKEGEFYPNMLEDGRIMYTRWDYLMKGYNVIQQLWAVNPDGRGASLLYGDHYAFSVGPIAFFEARQIPGTSRIICTGAAHHNTGVGPVMILDFEQNRGTRSSMVNVTPEVGYPEINSRMFREVVYEELPGKGISRSQNATGWYSSPFPLSEKHFLVCCSFEKNNAADAYGLYLMDIHHNRELIYRFPRASCYSPMPVRPRTTPRVIPDLVKGVDPKTPGTLLVTDVYQGLPGIPRGEAKYLRILETHSKTVHTRPQRCDIGVNSGWDVRGVLGTVPIEKDGSIYFRVPPYTQLFFEVLDEDYLEIRRMRNFMNVMPGEVNSCVGCHEPYGTAPMTAKKGMVMARRRTPSTIAPPPWGTGGFGFKRIVQPILDEKCVSCHDGTKGKDKSFDLRGLKMVPAPVGYDRDHAPHAQHLVSDSFLALLKFVSYVRVGGYQGEKLPLAPNATGSRRSKLMTILKEGHYTVKLDRPAWRAFAAWIDCNAPYYGGWDEIVLPEKPPKKIQASPVTPRPLRTQSAQDRARIAARITALNKKGSTVLAYLDCGLQVRSDGGTVAVKQVRGRGWTYKGTEGIKDLPGCHRDITFDQKRIVFDITGLTGRGHRLHLTWWDFNTDERRQSVWVSKPDGGAEKNLRKTAPLPAYLVRREMPETVTIDLPADAVVNGATRVSIRCDGGANAVLGEVWVTGAQ